jgi:hypothetical protein
MLLRGTRDGHVADVRWVERAAVEAGQPHLSMSRSRE